ncbi:MULTISPECIES: 5'-nucleotidase C-terminal domain-containing protein [Rhizobium/Agrobacterium group]|jgi:5'-nucleotidase/UDP-sugar diphosphatase|uniref:LysM peptidoglycan-binding domain-containing protein n=1 Tax=Agrobacterium tumefaciens TaxID=358 RepID=A0A8A5PF92_AGRTU|nr:MULTISPECIES: 5'-nucleotidase C-terminal domain-containing protein [Rhizobium/Agrobacterium group]MDP9563950.1 5'-nucleotidase [Rhizobium nepotum]MBO9110769.1 5'-nucleotidase C-terminal domain-containing protein [Agrobacterium sp. S2/73]MDP9758199.1 5'-nucleotidase/UDP-sugar diphosphatase [Agrobacterium tumefaciens]MDQ1219440.1 5'-nucleotidase/UDP-sugar diphosphatase [Agrobacterium sp. SORGH_AS_0745]MEA1842942.1 5'-nucleotidase C-terminal domain-containing protein [Agrobacterium tumefaciens
MKKILRLSMLSVSAITLSAGAALADYELNILHINDFHSRIESINKFDSTCSAEEEGKNECFGGAARLLTAINQTRDALKAQGKNVLLLNAGDNFQGSLFYTTYKGTVEAEVLNAMKFDAMTVGNHEFDDSEDGLAGFLDKVQFPVVTANVVASAASKIGDRVKPSIVLEVGGQKIGIVGAVANDTAELATPGPNITIAEDVAKISEQVQKLKGEGVNKIIALTHVGYPRDLEFIAKIPDVDVVVGGHSHTLLSNTDQKAEGPYPTLVDNPGGYKVPVVQAGQYSKYLGDLRVVFDDSGVVKESKGDPILIDSSFKPDEATLKRIDELKAPIEALKSKVVGTSEGPIEGDRKVCRVKECSMGNLVADATLARVKDQGVTIAFANSGGLRSSIDSGDVSMGEVLTVLPFQNTVATFQLKGEDIRAALENGVSQIDDGAGRFMQVSGMKYSFDRSKPAGSRVTAVEVKEGDAFVPLDPAKTYTVAANNYVRTGGDGFKVFATKAINAYDFGPNLEEAVAAYITANSPYKPFTDGRITEVTPAGYVAPAKPAAPAPAATAPAATATAPAATPAPAPTAPAATAPATTTPAAAAAAASKYVVAKGDSLWKIAAEKYGDGALWTRIAKANTLKHPNHIEIGEELEVPAQ